MTPVDFPRHDIRSLLDKRLALLKELTGLPAVFGGATRPGEQGSQLLISQLHGTLTDSLSGLAVPHGFGLGGRAVATGRPCAVNDYRSNRAITHHFDRHVVEDEKITAVFAFPVRANGRVAAVLYGASRGGPSIGDVALRVAGGVAVKLGNDLTSLLAEQEAQAATRSATAQALAEILSVAGQISDPQLRRRLVLAHRRLAAAAEPVAAQPDGRLAPRELEVLRLVSVGSSNIEIAGELGLSPETVKAYLRSAMRRLDVRNRTAAAHVARAAGLL